MEKNYLSENAVFIWRLRATEGMVLAAFLCGAVFVFSRGIAIAAGLVCALLYLVLMLFYIPALYQSYFFIFYEDGLLVEKGVLFHKRYKIPADRIQYTEFVQTPVQRLKHIYSAFFHTAGSIIILNQINEKSVAQIKKLTEDKSA